MRFVDEFKRSACFLCVELPDGEKHITGTVFFLHEPYEIDPTRNHLFAVTARHTIEGCRNDGYNNFYLRLNLLDGGADYYKINREWVFPETSNYWDIDAAVVLIELPPGFDLMGLPLDLCATPIQITSRYIGVGDELNILGLFKKRKGVRKNIPIVRTGNIAAMPEEEIPVTVKNSRGKDEIRYYHAYLVEMRSIKGLSGSPVYVWIPWGRPIRTLADRQLTSERTQSYEMYILGLIRAHWSVEPFEVVIDSVNDDDDSEDERDLLNTGIAAVTPITDVLDIIYGTEMTKQKKAKELEHVKRNEARPDADLPPKNTVRA